MRCHLCVGVADARAAVGAADGLALEASVEINRHARGGFASFHIERDFRGGIGEVAGVRADALEQPHCAGPAFVGDARLVRAGFCGDDVHLLLHEHFEGLVCGAALDGIRDGERAEVARVGEVAPLVRFGEAEARELVAIVGDAKCAERRAEPAAFFIVVGLAAEDGRDGFSTPKTSGCAAM